MIKNDSWIRSHAATGMIVPYESKQVRSLPSSSEHAGGAVLSFGVSSYGYDIRCSRQFRIFAPTWGTVVDPKNFDAKAFVEHEGDFCVIPPNSFVLTSSVERIKVPRDVLILCIGKSTYARCGIVCGCTPLEPEWEGHVTIELSNTTPLPVKIYAGEGVAQLLFLGCAEACETSYADRNGKYQDQAKDPLPPQV
jgi:dCTP deaminase